MPARPRRLDELGGEPLHPPVDRDVIDGDAALGQQFLDVPVGQPIPQVPPDRERDHRRREPEACEDRSGAMCSHPTSLRPSTIDQRNSAGWSARSLLGRCAGSARPGRLGRPSPGGAEAWCGAARRPRAAAPAVPRSSRPMSGRAGLSQPQSLAKIKYSRRRDAADHHGLPLTPMHRCSSAPTGLSHPKAHPERFRSRPYLPPLPARAWINQPPATRQTSTPLQTTEAA